MNDFGNLFTNKFDAQIHKLLGDTVVVTHPTLGNKTIQCVFLKNSDEEELNSRVDDYHPIIRILDSDFAFFEDRSATVSYNGEIFGIYDEYPIEKLRHEIVLQDIR